MNEHWKKIEHYVHLLNTVMGIRISVEIDGLLGVVKKGGEIIFTTAGPNSQAVIEAYLTGFVTALTR